VDKQRLQINAEVIVEVTDEAAMRRAALEAVELTAFVSEADRAKARAELQTDSLAALQWLVEPLDLLPEIDGVTILEDSSTVMEHDGATATAADVPDFAQLFSVCRCGQPACERCSGWQFTPRTALALWTVAQILADHAYDDVIEHGDEPISDEREWGAFSRYPRVTWRQDAVWRRQAARCYDDLTTDLEAARWPRPTCPADEMALHLILEDAQAAVADGWAGMDQPPIPLPDHPDDFDWETATDVLFQDTDILDLFEASRDGIENPDNEENRAAGMGDYRPSAWFKPFRNMATRDGRRPFRR
jgi:hypothetical protein